MAPSPETGNPCKRRVEEKQRKSKGDNAKVTCFAPALKGLGNEIKLTIFKMLQRGELKFSPDHCVNSGARTLQWYQ
jgi:hypothetical protein